MIRPELRSDATIVEQTYRGEQSYIVKEHATHKYYRFKALEVLVMQEFDGQRTCAEIAAALAEQGVALKVASVESFARKLDGMGLLERTVAERSVLLMERLRAERSRRVKRTHYTGSILRMRWSVGDPNAFFDRWTPRLKFFFSRTFLALSVALFVTYAVIVVSRSAEFTAALASLYQPSTWTLRFIVLFWMTGIVVIVIHESGHGFACKHFGGEVHEMGAMLIYGQPAFFCNVNDAWTFPRLSARLWVTAAGSWIQMVVAALAAMVWWAAEPGTIVSQVALIAALIGGVTTVLANANPLIPLDGYYALSDWLEIPNLRGRAFAYLEYLVRRHVFRLAVPGPQADQREKRVFLVYGLLALVYSVTILALLAGRLLGWISATLGALGVIALAFMLWAAAGRQVWSWVRTAATSLREHRGVFRSPRLWRRGAATLLAVLLVGFLVPWPIQVGGTFTTATPLDVAFTAPEDAQIGRVVADEGARVAAGAPILVLRNLNLERQAIALAWSADSLGALEQRARADGRTADAERLGASRREADGAASALRSRLERFTLRSPVPATVVTARLAELEGLHVDRGDPVVRLSGEPDTVELRIALDRAGATLVRAGQASSVVPYSDLGAAVRGRVLSVSTAGAAADSGRIEARIRLPASAAFRPGVTGEARITIARSTVFGALWWAVRKRVRSDLLL